MNKGAKCCYCYKRYPLYLMTYINGQGLGYACHECWDLDPIEMPHEEFVDTVRKIIIEHTGRNIEDSYLRALIYKNVCAKSNI